ncbi:hypothetical protein ACFSR7_15565 [Cohnella sp. GCM10020058]|uniref:hypothetical protein n=1 Tax=Cohnella sp. GCM10020058 TaxID=3317330 RepID=UPI00363648F1
MVDLPMLLYKVTRRERVAVQERLTLMLAAGNRGMDDEGYKAFAQRLAASLEEQDDNEFDRSALSALRRRMDGG